MMHLDELRACVAILEFANRGGEVRNQVSEDVAHALLIDLEERKILKAEEEKEPAF